MTTEPGYEQIDAFHAAFQKRLKKEFPKFGHGHKALAHHGGNARIVFVDRGGSLDTASEVAETGGEDGDIAGDATRWDIHVWGPDRRTVIELYRDLIRAMRDTVESGFFLDFEGDYDIDEAGENSRGRKLTKLGLVIHERVRARTDFDYVLTPVEHFETKAGTIATLPTPEEGEEDVVPSYEELTQDFEADEVSITQDAEE